jgi:cytochrome c oxidase subunit 3
VAARHNSTQSRFALRFLSLALAVYGTAASITYLLIEGLGRQTDRDRPPIPGAFWLSTLILLVGSILLHRGLFYVRVERQRPFRRCLAAGLVAGTLFVGVQSYGLWCLAAYHGMDDAQTGATPFVFVFAALHVMHFGVALLFLVFVTLKGLMDWYDHEYYWGVTVCTYFWHLLLMVWLCILGVLLIVA